MSDRTNLATDRYGFVIIKVLRRVATNPVSVAAERTHQCLTGPERRAPLGRIDQDSVHLFQVMGDTLRMSAAGVQIVLVAVNVASFLSIILKAIGIRHFLVVKWRHHHGGKTMHKLGLRCSPFGANDDTLLVDLLHAVGRCAGQSRWDGTVDVHADVNANVILCWFPICVYFWIYEK